MNKPNFADAKSEQQWLDAKADRRFVIELSKSVDKDVKGEINLIVQELARAGQGVQQLFFMLRDMGLQLDALVTLITKAIPEFRENFREEHKKLRVFITEIDKYNGQGEHSSKPFEEKLALIRAWNNENENKIKGFHVGLEEYILSHAQEFTPIQVEALCEEFSMKIQEQHSSVYQPVVTLA